MFWISCTIHSTRRYLRAKYDDTNLGVPGQKQAILWAFIMLQNMCVGFPHPGIRTLFWSYLKETEKCQKQLKMTSQSFWG